MLTWKTPHDNSIRRHVLTAQASLDFDPAQGIFRLTSAPEGAKLRLEADMLLPSEKPQPEQQRSVEESLKAAAENPWDKSTIIPALRAWVRSLDSRGDFEDTIARQTQASDSPLIHFAPALILRRRTSQTVLAAIERILRSLQDGGPIPPEIIRLVVDADDFGIADGEQSNDEQHTGFGIPTETIYFPLPANQDQRQIVETLYRRRGVLVQGPPGTGKSHTIANLICHLLATGKRVLVTAQTPRALRVLKDKLPADIRPLCVSVLGNDRAAMLNLEQSVNEISGRHARWNSERNLSTIKQFERELADARKREAKLEAELRSIREKETRRHEVAGGAYCGTAQQIAHELAQKTDTFDWLVDPIRPDAEIPFGPTVFEQLRQTFLEITANREAELALLYPAPNSVPTPDAFQQLVNREKTAEKTHDSFTPIRGTSQFDALTRTGVDSTASLDSAIRELRAAIQAVKRRPLEWIKGAIHGLLSDQDAPWKTLREMTAALLDSLRTRSVALESPTLVKPDSVSAEQLLADALDLKAHLDSGRGWGWWVFSSRTAKRARYLQLVRLDGRPCENREVLSRLIDFLEGRRELDKLWNLWTGKVERTQATFALQVSELSEQLEALDAVLSLEPKLHAAKKACVGLIGLAEPAWHDAECLDAILQVCDSATAHRTVTDTRCQIETITSCLNATAFAVNAHPVCARIIDSVRAREVESYTECFRILQKLIADQRILQQRQERFRCLRDLAPEVANLLARSPSDISWSERLSVVADAWNWARAKSWLEEYLRPDREVDIESQIRQVTEETGRLTASLAASLAWQHFFDRMKESERQHLMAWQQAIKKVGKGMGKYAAKHRRDAQEHLDRCRNAIPAWVMPLFRVIETVSPEPEMFDVVIVDEASQCGPDALALLYLAKRIVIVGDDQQISPEAVGINQGDVDHLIRQHLCELDHSDSFGVTSSLFDHGAIRYGNRVVLREHFRCMPEIIRFSNDLCYTSAPLIPLRQYPPKRLRPVVTRYVQTGYREGDSSRAINRPEAEDVVRAIVMCCRDPLYENRTFGVISLQGDAQARLIETMLLEQLDAKEIEDRHLICGDAYSFQGDERHVMFLSMIAAPNSRIGPLTKESDKRRFNVAASRAQDQMWLFHSPTLEELSTSCLRYSLLKYCLHPTTQRITREGLNIDELRRVVHASNRHKMKPPRPFDSWFELDVFLNIVSKGFRVIPQFRVAEYRIDLVVEGTSARLAVECDGDEFHGAERHEEDRARQRTLERSGWRFWRVRGSEYYRDPQFALKPLWELIESYGIEVASEDFSGDMAVDGYVPSVDWDAPFVSARGLVT